MSYTINLHLLDNKQIKVDKDGFPLGNENSYRLMEHEENVSEFHIASKPTDYQNADYYVIFINSQGKRAFLDDIIPEPITDDGQLIIDDTFMLPIGMSVAGYGYIRLYAIQGNNRIEFMPIKVKIWDTIETWRDYATDLDTLATQGWVRDYVAEHGGSVVSVSETGTSTDEVNYITINGVEKKIGGSGGAVDSVNGKTGVVVLDADDVGALPDSTKYAANMTVSMNSSTYVLTFRLQDQNGTNIGNARTVDLPLETMVVNGSYDSVNKKVILTLKNGNTIEFSVADLIDGLQEEITAQNKLNADLVDDTNSTHKFVTAQNKQDWDNKSDFSGSYNDLTDKPTIPTALSQLSDDSTHRTVTDTDKGNWNGKSVVSVSDTGTSTDEISYITINGVEKKLVGTKLVFATSADIESLFD